MNLYFLQIRDFVDHSTYKMVKANEKIMMSNYYALSRLELMEVSR